MLTGFPFSANKDARVLILGSMPSRKSLDVQQYYAHPRNAFWPITGTLFGFDAAVPYAQRLRLLRSKRVALWDVAHQCMRPGSLDADIREVETNDFATFFTAHPCIRHIFFNGRKAAAMYRRLVLPKLSGKQQILPATLLPSTSPAYASLSMQEKLSAWSIVAGHVACPRPAKR